MNSEKVDVSIVLACYNAASYVVESVRQIEEVMDATIFSYELIFIDDKSGDDTISKIQDVIRGKKNRFLYVHANNLGRGKTVCDGFMRARGDIVGFIDLDLDNPARYIFSMISGIKYGGADVCTALRVYRWKFDFYFFIRLLASKSYAFLSRKWLGTGLKDTETGCKFFRKEKLLPLLGEVQDDKWFWDTEIMARAYYAGLKIVEIPTLFIRNTHVSTVHLLPDTCRYISSLIRFRGTKELLKKRNQCLPQGNQP